MGFYEGLFFVCVCVLFLSTRDLHSLALQQKSPNLYFAHNHAGWNRLAKLIGLRSQFCKHNSSFWMCLFCNIHENYFSNLLSSRGKCWRQLTKKNWQPSDEKWFINFWLLELCQPGRVFRIGPDVHGLLLRIKETEIYIKKFVELEKRHVELTYDAIEKSVRLF